MSIKSLNFNTAFSDNQDETNPRWTFEKINGVQSIKVKNCMVPLALDNITSYNNTLKVLQNISGTTSANIITLPIGNYNSSNFTTALQTGLNSLGNLYYTASFNTFGNKITISSSTGSLSLLNYSNNVYTELGLNSLQIGTTSNSLTMTDPIDLSGIKQLNILSNINACDVIGQNYNLLASIPVEESLNTISTFIDHSNDYVETNNNEINTLSLEIRDEKFRKVSLNKDWNITINFLTD